jgi:hypothetical protein
MLRQIFEEKNGSAPSCLKNSRAKGSEINSQTQSFDAYRNSFLRVISVIIEIINYPFKLGKMRFKSPIFFFISGPPP